MLNIYLRHEYGDFVRKLYDCLLFSIYDAWMDNQPWQLKTMKISDLKQIQIDPLTIILRFSTNDVTKTAPNDCFSD
jgi:hypothetical protein